MDRDELQERSKCFALRVVKLVEALPNTIAGRAMGQQMIRSGTSVAANYRAARRGRSRKEFIAKLGVVTEEADETAFWLEMVIESEQLKESQVRPLLDEAEALTRIFARSARSARATKSSDPDQAP